MSTKKKNISLTLVVCWLVFGLCLATIGPSAAKNNSHPSSVAKHKKIGKTDCKDCHSALLKKTNLHPVAEDCSSCHEYTETKDAAEVKLTADGTALCLTCHADKQEDFSSKKFKHAAAEADCVACHDPHSTGETALLKDKVNRLCFACHTDKDDEITKKPFVHAPVKDVGCFACHEPHTSNFPSLLKLKVNDLCLACHRVSAGEKLDKNDKVIILHRATPEKYATKAKKIILGKDGKGHPYIGHPVADVPDPSNPKQVMTCLSCHNPHAGKVVQMYKGDVSKSALCDRCHKER